MLSMFGKPIRLAQVMRPAAGGMRRHIATLLTGLDPYRYAPTLFAPEDFALTALNMNVAFGALPIGSKTHPAADLKTIAFLAKEINGNFDILHAHGLRGALIGVMAAHRVGIPSIFTAHNLLPHLSPIPRFIFTYVARRASRIIAVSEAVAQTLLDAGAPKKSLTVIPNGVDLPSFNAAINTSAVREQFGLEQNSPLIVAAGRFAPEKGFDVLIEAMALLQARLPRVQLALVGSGPMDERLRAEAEFHCARVVFTGHQTNVAPLLQSADLVAIPSREEGQGIVALEAMAARRAIVASRVGGLIETVLNGETGLLVEPEKPAALAGALHKLLTDDMRRVEMGEAGRERVECEYTASKMVSRIEGVYREVIQKSHPVR